MKKQISLIKYKRVKTYLIACVAAIVASQITTYISVFEFIKQLMGDVPYQDIKSASLLGWISNIFYLIFFVFLVLLLLQIVEYYRDKKD